MRASTRLAIALSIACAAQGLTARAQESDIEATHRRGQALRDEGRHDEARQLFEALWQRTREPRALARLALAEGALRLWVQAEAHLTQALEAADDPWIRENRERLEGNLRSQRENVGVVDVVCDTPGARVSIRGGAELSLPLPRPVRVTTGELSLAVSAPGHRTQRRTVLARRLAAGPLVERFTLERLRPDELAAPAPPSQALRYVGFTLIGVGAVLGGLSTWQYLAAADIASKGASASFNSDEPYRSWFFYMNQTNPQRTLSSSEVCERAQNDAVNPYAPEARNLCARVGTANALAVGFLIPAIATIAAGAVMVAVAPRAPASPRVALTPHAGPSGSGLTLTGSF